METNLLKAKTRLTEGGPTPNVLRKNGLMPAVVYGQGKTPLTLAIDMNDLKNLLNHITNQTLISLDIEGDTTSSKTVMIKEMQRHPVSRKFIHADFYEVDMTKELHINVPVNVTGKSMGVEEGGTLQVIRRSLEVICLPGNIPESIDVDISGLGIGDSIHISEIVTSGDVKLTWDSVEEADYTVITIAAPTVEEEPEEELEEGVEEAAAEGAPEEEEKQEADNEAE